MIDSEIQQFWSAYKGTRHTDLSLARLFVKLAVQYAYLAGYAEHFLPNDLLGDAFYKENSSIELEAGRIIDAVREVERHGSKELASSAFKNLLKRIYRQGVDAGKDIRRKV